MKRMVWIACIMMLITGCIFDTDDSPVYDITGSWYGKTSGIEMLFSADKTVTVRSVWEGEYKVFYTGTWTFDGYGGTVKQDGGNESSFIRINDELIFNNRVNDARYCWVRR